MATPESTQLPPTLPHLPETGEQQLQLPGLILQEAHSSGPLQQLSICINAYLSPEEIHWVMRAFFVSMQSHSGQYRKSGEPYVEHPILVALIVAQWRLDYQAVCAALLHDVIEDSTLTAQDVCAYFGPQIAALVDGVSKLEKVEHHNLEDRQASNHQKMLLAMAKDIRVILVKLADRLHNMRTLQAMAPHKRRIIARETEEIYSPIANRLGLYEVCNELNEQALRHLFPNRYAILCKAVKKVQGDQESVIHRTIETIETALKQNQIEATVCGRRKNIFGIYEKMKRKQLSFSQVSDIYGFRVCVSSLQACYLSIGILHGLYKPVPQKFKDYIAIPKSNGYQSLHTTLVGPHGRPIEVQVRTHEMHCVSETGVAAHWLYKDNNASLSLIQQQTHDWIQSLLELQSISGNSKEFLDHMKSDLFSDEIYIFTKNKEIKVLPKHACVIDFAYAIHSHIGHSCHSAIVNNKKTSIRHKLQNGDLVEVITSPSSYPKASWLSHCKTAKSRSQIRHYLKAHHSDRLVLLGKRLLNKELFALGYKQEITSQQWASLLKSTQQEQKDIYLDIGIGKKLAIAVARHLIKYDSSTKDTPPFLIKHADSMTIQTARCCHPIPGDPIVGSLQKGHMLLVHIASCPVFKHNTPQKKQLNVSWNPLNQQHLYPVLLKALAANQRGCLGKICLEITKAQCDIEHLVIHRKESTTSWITLEIKVQNRRHLAHLLNALRIIPEVQRIQRIRHSTELDRKAIT